MKFAFFGYDFSKKVLERLLSDGHEIQMLFTFECDNIFNFNKDIINLAQHKKVSVTLNKPTPQDIGALVKNGTDLFISCGYPYKIPEIHNKNAYGINAHPSLLPRGRGLMPVPHILMHEPEVAGFTIHKLTNEYDAGDILYQEAIKLTDADTVDSYSAQIAECLPTAISKIVTDISQYWQNATPQDQSQATTFAPPTAHLRTLNWNDPIEKIDRIARAFGSFGCIADIEGEKIALFKHSIEKTPHTVKNSSVVDRDESAITVAVKGGLVKIEKFTHI